MDDIDNGPHAQLIRDLQEHLGIIARNPLLLLQALTHDSYYREMAPQWGSNERLEFLGDSILGMVISHQLYQQFPDYSEGLLAQMKAYLVSTEFLAQKACELNIGKFILLGKGEEMSGGRERPSVLTDTYEALIAALYLDQGIEAVEVLIASTSSSDLEHVTVNRKNSKSLLQENIQKHFKSLPLYTVVKEEGPPHQKRFYVRVFFNGDMLGEGSGCSKKVAEKMAAHEALEHFENYLEKEIALESRNGKEESC
jgi:ribonuclease III